MPEVSPRLIAIGFVRRAHGVRGEVRVEPYNEDSELLLDLDEVVLEQRGKPARTVAIRACRPAHQAFLVTFDGVSDKNGADALKGSLVLVPRELFPPPEPGEYYHADLVGLAVHASDGTLVGEVVRVERTPAQDLLVVGGPAGERFVPLVDVVVRSIDLEARRIDLEPWEDGT